MARPFEHCSNEIVNIRCASLSATSFHLTKGVEACDLFELRKMARLGTETLNQFWGEIEQWRLFLD